MTRKATDNLGSHLLGRKVKHDPKDYSMRKALDKLNSDDPVLDKTLREAIDERNPLVTTWKGILQLWKIIKAFLSANPAPTPEPPSPTPTPDPVTSRVWTDNAPVLDQGQTGHCVGFSWAQFGNTDPINDNYDNEQGHAIYYECKVLDGEPRAEDGSYVRTGAKAMKNRGRIATYVFSTNIQDVKEWLLTQGPVTVGSDWMNDMFDPDGEYYVHPQGGVAGGHAYLCVGYDAPTDTYIFQNSWGSGWADGGRFKMHAQDFQLLLSRDGEACGTTEQPL
jgi:hypothetical protein